MSVAVTPLSVIVGTRQGWPAIQPCIDALLPQVREVGGEMVVADGSGWPAPDLGQLVRWLKLPTSMSVFQLRHEAYRAAGGSIVAQTEDHCRVAPGWCSRILDQHARHPEAVAIGGALDNGTGEHLIDWAAFVVTQIPYVAPLPTGPVERTTGAANISLRRDAVNRLSNNDGFGTVELFASADLLRGGILLQDDQRIVYHDQSMGIVGTSAIEFHNGRALGGLRRRVMDRRDWLRVAGAGLLPFYRSGRAVRMAFQKRVPRGAVVGAIPWIVWLELCTSAGELIGYASGPGDSPKQLR